MSQVEIDGCCVACKSGWAERLHAFQALIAEDSKTLARQLQDFLAMAAEQFGADFCTALRVDGDHFTVLAVHGSGAHYRLRERDVVPIGDTFAHQVLTTSASAFSHDVANDPAFQHQPYFAPERPAAYLGSPILIGHRLFGVLSMMSATPRPPFDPAEIALVELMGQALGNLVERDQLGQKRREADRQRWAAGRLLQTAFDSAPIGMALGAIDGRWLQVNQALCQLLGYSEAELLATDCQSVTHAEDNAEDRTQLRALLAGTSLTCSIEKRLLHKDGRTIWVMRRVALVREQDGSPRCFVSQIQSIDAQKMLIAALEHQQEALEAANRKLTLLAAIDPLTEALNRRALREKLDELDKEAVASGQPLAFLMVDVDHFKSYNDRYGHMDGDQALRIIAKTLVAASRASDVVGRFGGEEFLVLLPDTDAAAARMVAERLRISVAQSEEMREPTTVSIGVHVLMPTPDRETVNQAIVLADNALYLAKRQGRNRVELA